MERNFTMESFGSMLPANWEPAVELMNEMLAVRRNPGSLQYTGLYSLSTYAYGNPADEADVIWEAYCHGHYDEEIAERVLAGMELAELPAPVTYTLRGEEYVFQLVWYVRQQDVRSEAGLTPRVALLVYAAAWQPFDGHSGRLYWQRDQLPTIDEARRLMRCVEPVIDETGRPFYPGCENDESERTNGWATDGVIYAPRVPDEDEWEDY